MQYIRLAATVLAVFFFTSVQAQQQPPLPNVEKGEGFVEIIPAQPTQDNQKVEIIEFFWYGCPHCYTFEPYVSEWAANLPENVVFIRQPAIFSPKWAPGARAFFVAEALEITDKIHQDFFDAVQRKRPLETQEQLAEFFAEHGVRREDFDAAYNSFIVATRMRQAEGMAARYGVSGVPAVVINGKYRSNGTLAKSYPGLISVMNTLTAREAEGLKTKE